MFMLTKQDIAVLSDLLDQGLHPIKEDLQMLHKEFIGLNNKFNGLRQDMNEKIDGLREEMHAEISRLDNKIDTKIDGLREEMHAEISGLREEMKTEIGRLDNKIDIKIDGLREEMHAEISRLDNKIDGLREEMHAEISRLDNKIDSLREEMHRGFAEIHTILNTDISPRLKTIEDCYLKTFERYSEGAERQKKMEEDISVMKDVIQEHSVQLRKLCS